MPPPPPIVLIVDDNPDVRASTAQILELEGYPTATAANGAEALAGTFQQPAAAADPARPADAGHGRWEFRRQQRQDPALAAIPVAVLSGADATEQRGDPMDAIRYLVKPVPLAVLLELVARYCP